MWDCLEELDELEVAVVRHPHLAAEVVVVGRDESGERQPTLVGVLEQLHHLLAELEEGRGQEGGAPPKQRGADVLSIWIQEDNIKMNLMGAIGLYFV